MKKEVEHDGVRIMLSVTDDKDSLVIEVEVENLIGNELYKHLKKDYYSAQLGVSSNFGKYYTGNNYEIGKPLAYMVIHKDDVQIVKKKWIYNKIKQVGDCVIIMLQYAFFYEGISIEIGDTKKRAIYEFEFYEELDKKIIEENDGIILDQTDNRMAAIIKIAEDGLEVLKRDANTKKVILNPSLRFD